MKTLKQNMKGQDIKLRQCYVYEIQIDGVVRYIGKGRNGRIYSHLIDAKRTASRRRQDSQSISAFSENASAVRRGLNIEEKMVACNLTDSGAYTMERQMIGNYHKWHAGQLWNTIDERSMDPKNLPKKWANPVHSLYRISGPFNELLDRSRAHQLDRMDRRAS